MLLRVRCADGTVRIPADGATTLAGFYGMVRAALDAQLSVRLPGDARLRLATLPTAKFDDDATVNPVPHDGAAGAATLGTLGLKHGDMLYLVVDKAERVEGEEGQEEEEEEETKVVRRVVDGALVEVPVEKSFYERRLDYARSKCARHPPRHSCAACVAEAKIHVESEDVTRHTAISFSKNAAAQFQSYVKDRLGFSVQRCGLLYGRVLEDTTAADAEGIEIEDDVVPMYLHVDFIYEPPQEGAADAVSVLRNDEEDALVDAIANALGVSQIGWIISHDNRGKEGEDAVRLSVGELAQVGEFRRELGDDFATVVVSLSDDGAETHFEAYQSSNIFQVLHEEGVFDYGESEKPTVVTTAEPVILERHKEVEKVDLDYFLVPLAIRTHEDAPLTVGFPVENRAIRPTVLDLKDHLEARKSLPFVQRVADFHLLLFVAQTAGVEVVLPVLEALVEGTHVPEGTELLITSIAGSFG